MYVEEQSVVPWETLNVIVSDITYGGRVTDIWDKRAISSILRKYFDANLLDDSCAFTENGLYYAPGSDSSDVKVTGRRCDCCCFFWSFLC